jgi:hypothetical protein
MQRRSIGNQVTAPVRCAALNCMISAISQRSSAPTVRLSSCWRSPPCWRSGILPKGHFAPMDAGVPQLAPVPVRCGICLWR